MSDEEILHITLDQAVKLGKRAICADEGCRIERVFCSLNFDGSVCWKEYACSRCDVVVSLSYPD